MPSDSTDPRLEPKPGAAVNRIAVIFLQPQCNMTCRFCATEDGFQSLTLEQGMSMVQALQANGVDNVILGGGEPFAWKPGPLNLARYAKSLGMFVQIGTNGIALPKGFATNSWVDRYILPLESSEGAIHDTLRLHDGGHHQVILDRLEALGYAGKQVTLSTVVTSANIYGLGYLGKRLSWYHGAFGTLHAWHLYRLLPIGRGGAKHGPGLSISLEAYHGACEKIRHQEPDLHIIKRPDMLRSSTVGFFWVQGGRCRSMSPYPVEFH